MFRSLLIANRGEIACRVMGSARRLGLRSIAIYSEADAAALHVEQADEAHLIGPAPAAESYLDIDAVLDAARKSGAEAIHPGYGFLAENADFAEACVAAGLIFVGPPADAIRAMGSKSEAKVIMAKAGVSLVPGYHGEDQGADRLRAAADEIGYPVLIKASAGGGGKGMRMVERPQDFSAALAAAKRESAAAFGDERMLIERYLIRPRHIEVQVFADSHGNLLHLFERDCSIQRRHQKVIEEAPAPGVDEDFRKAMAAAAITAAKAIGYVGAGTVEFIVAEESFFFMEMNTRLQVEHAVTEMITGQDLVEWQLRVAAGEVLPVMQEALEPKGHAIEVRLYAEDPTKDFLPATGKLVHLRFPEPDRYTRIDSGVRAGDDISVYYDPMIAKLIVWDQDRAGAVARLRAALGASQAVGVTTNLAFLRAVAAHPAFEAAELDTGFILRHRESLLPEPGEASDQILALASLAEILHRKADAQAQALRSNDPHSPWHLTNGWRLNSDTHTRLLFHDGPREVPVKLHYRPEGYQIELPGSRLQAAGKLDPSGELVAALDGQRVTATVLRHGLDLTVLTGEEERVLRLHDPLDLGSAESLGDGRLTAPMPGKITQVLVEPGALVTRGAPILLLEAMKMEHTITAPDDGTVVAVHCAVGDLVEEGVELLAFEAVEGGEG